MTVITWTRWWWGVGVGGSEGGGVQVAVGGSVKGCDPALVYREVFQLHGSLIFLPVVISAAPPLLLPPSTRRGEATAC